MAFEALFEPIKIGPVEIKNRIAMAPMAIHDFSMNGRPLRQAVCYFNARARGGTGLIIAGAIMGTKSSAAELGNVSCLYDGSHTYDWMKLVQSVHSHGAKIFAQMSPGFGRKAIVEHPQGASTTPINTDIIEEGLPDKALAYKPWWPRSAPVFTRMHETIPRELPIEEIRAIENEFVNSCQLAIHCGFDGIELHGCHGYLIDQFLSPIVNRRSDIYGGSLRNRARFLLELLRKCKDVFGDAVPVTVRISGAERIEGGNEPEDMRQIAVWCEELGADAIHLSDGVTTERYKYEIPEVENTEPGRLIDIQGKKLKKVVKVPVITPSIHIPENAERVIKEGETDMISLGKALLADPDWANKVKEGKVDKINRCTRCMWCLGMGILGLQGIIGCRENPNIGYEQYMPEYYPKPSKQIIPESLRRWRPAGGTVIRAGH